MTTLLALGAPAGALLLVIMWAGELLLQRRRKRRGTPLSEVYVNEITAMFYGTKRVELNHRDSVEMLRQEEAQGAPPGLGVDLDRGVVVVRPDGHGRAPARRAPERTFAPERNGGSAPSSSAS
ncbi:MAG TPA: DUF6191 domain-containing protein [Pseudonocardiaceae bacterium]